MPEIDKARLFAEIAEGRYDGYLKECGLAAAPLIIQAIGATETEQSGRGFRPWDSEDAWGFPAPDRNPWHPPFPNRIGMPSLQVKSASMGMGEVSGKTGSADLPCELDPVSGAAKDLLGKHRLAEALVSLGPGILPHIRDALGRGIGVSVLPAQLEKMIERDVNPWSQRDVGSAPRYSAVALQLASLATGRIRGVESVGAMARHRLVRIFESFYLMQKSTALLPGDLGFFAPRAGPEQPRRFGNHLSEEAKCAIFELLIAEAGAKSRWR